MDERYHLDIAANRNTQKYSRQVQFLRVLWGAVGIIFRFSPRTAFGWRRFLLRLFGAKIGKDVHIYNTAIIYMPWFLEIGDWSSIGENAYIYNLCPVEIGKNVTISQRSHLCAGTHDYRKRDMPLIKKPIRITDNAWICADAFIGPGVTVAEASIVGARCVQMKDTEPYGIYTGNPSRRIGKREIH